MMKRTTLFIPLMVIMALTACTPTGTALTDLTCRQATANAFSESGEAPALRNATLTESDRTERSLTCAQSADAGTGKPEIRLHVSLADDGATIQYNTTITGAQQVATSQPSTEPADPPSQGENEETSRAAQTADGKTEKPIAVTVTAKNQAPSPTIPPTMMAPQPETPAMTPPPPTPTEGQRTLQKAADTWAASINERKWTDLHQLHPRTFRDKCTEAEFEEYAHHLNSVPGYPKVPNDTRVNIQGISIDGTNGEVRYHLRRNGQEIGGSAAAITLQHDGDRWALTLPREILGQDQPCNMDNYLTRGKNRPHPAGSSVHGTDGALITVTNIDANAWDTIQKENSWNDSPDRGKRLIIVRIKVVNASGAGGIDVDERYFELPAAPANSTPHTATHAGSIQIG